MATMLPPQAPPGTSRPEMLAFTAISRLPADWIAFHSVPWFGEEREGEGDFLVISPSGGWVFLEVKGRCSVDGTGQWTRHKSSVVIKDPWEQAKVTGREVVRRLKKVGVPRRPAAYVACFPVGEPHFSGGLARQQQRSVSAGDLDAPARLGAVLESALAEAASRDREPLIPFTTDELETIRITLLVTGQVHVPPPTAVTHAEQHRAELTDEQTETYVDLMSTNKMLTVGGAGTGKTMLAAARAAQMSRQGISTIVIAAHGLLAQRIDYLVRQNHGDPNRVQVFSLSQLAAKTVNADWRPAQLLDDKFWRASLAGAQLAADGLIIDDAQHLPPKAVYALTTLQQDAVQASTYLFADFNQTAYNGWIQELDDLMPLPLTVRLRRNCRNTRQICSLLANLLGRAVEPAEIDGPPVKLITSNTRWEAVSLACQEAASLLEDGLSANSIAVLYDDLSWYRYLWEAPDAENDDLSNDSQQQDSLADYYAENDLSWANIVTQDWERPAPLDLDDSIAVESDGSLYGGYTYYIRRRTTLEVTLSQNRTRVVRCLHLESAVGLEFDAVILLVDPSNLDKLNLEEVIGRESFGDELELIDDDGFDAGVWLKSLSGPDSIIARAYVGCSRARTILKIIGSEKALSPLRSMREIRDN